MKLQRCKYLLILFAVTSLPSLLRAESVVYDLSAGSANNVRAATNSKPVNFPAGWLCGGLPIGSGNTVRSGTGAPSNSLGIDGDFYIDLTPSPKNMYGPKAAGVWPSPFPLGSTGATGAGVATGGTTGQILKKNSNTDFDTSWFTSSGTGTVTSVAIALNTTGTDIGFTGGPITAAGTLTLSIPTASSINRGALSAADWIIFNNKLATNGNGSGLTGLLFSQFTGADLQPNQIDTAYTTIPYTSLTDGATITWTMNADAHEQHKTVTLGGNRALAFAGATNGMSGVLIVKQDATGSRTLTLPAGSKVVTGGGGVITLTTTANAIDVLSWTYDGTNYFWSYGKNFN